MPNLKYFNLLIVEELLNTQELFMSETDNTGVFCSIM